MFTVLLHLAEETIIQDSSLGLSYLLALPNVSICQHFTYVIRRGSLLFVLLLNKLTLWKPYWSCGISVVQSTKSESTWQQLDNRL